MAVPPRASAGRRVWSGLVRGARARAEAIALPDHLHDLGVQIGVVNYAGNNPVWARILPLINLHL